MTTTESHEALSSPTNMNTGPKRPWCLFQSGSEAYAVGLETVAEVVEVDRLVRIPHCPPRIVALCSLRREVIPVVDLSETPTERSASSLSSKTIVLLLRTTRGTWGIPVSAEGTLVSAESMNEAKPGVRSTTRGSRMGTLCKGSTTYTVIDAEATWHEVRRSIDAWYQNQAGVDPALQSPTSRTRNST